MDNDFIVVSIASNGLLSKFTQLKRFMNCFGCFHIEYFPKSRKKKYKHEHVYENQTTIVLFVSFSHPKIYIIETSQQRMLYFSTHSPLRHYEKLKINYHQFQRSRMTRDCILSERYCISLLYRLLLSSFPCCCCCTTHCC